MIGKSQLLNLSLESVYKGCTVVFSGNLMVKSSVGEVVALQDRKSKPAAVNSCDS